MSNKLQKRKCDPDYVPVRTRGGALIKPHPEESLKTLRAMLQINKDAVMCPCWKAFFAATKEPDVYSRLSKHVARLSRRVLSRLPVESSLAGQPIRTVADLRKITHDIFEKFSASNMTSIDSSKNIFSIKVSRYTPSSQQIRFAIDFRSKFLKKQAKINVQFYSGNSYLLNPLRSLSVALDLQDQQNIASSWCIFVLKIIAMLEASFNLEISYLRTQVVMPGNCNADLERAIADRLFANDTTEADIKFIVKKIRDLIGRVNQHNSRRPVKRKLPSKNNMVILPTKLSK